MSTPNVSGEIGTLAERAAAAVQEAEEQARRNEVSHFIARAKVGRHLLRKVLGIESELADWQPCGREAGVEVDGVRLHTWRSSAYFGGTQDTLRFGEHDVRSLLQLGRLIQRDAEHSGSDAQVQS